MTKLQDPNGYVTRLPLRSWRRAWILERGHWGLGFIWDLVPWSFGFASFVGIWVLVIGISTAWPAASSRPTGPRIVLIIRHAEKPDETTGAKDPDLAPRGFERAKALAHVIPEHFIKPDYLIATKRSKASNRPYETIEPLSKALHEDIEAKFKDDDFPEVAQEVLTDPKFAGKVVLIAWHHGKIPELAKALGAKHVPAKWNPAVFDRVWEIDYQNGQASWKDQPQHALPGDAER